MAERAQMQDRLAEQARQIDGLKKNSSGPVEEARLGGAMAQAQDLAKRLRGLDSQLGAKRRELLAAADRVLAETQDPGQRARAMQIRAETASRLAQLETAPALGATLGIGERESDGPEELQEKADLLKDTQDKIQRELAVLDKRYQAAKRRTELLQSVHSLDTDLFGESVRRPRGAQLSPRDHTDSGLAGKTGGQFNSPATPTAGQTATPGGASTNPTAPNGPPASTDPGTGNPGAGPTPGPTPSPTTGGQPPYFGPASPTPLSPLADVIALKDLLDPGTLADLSRPKDSVAYLRALERARQRLAAISADLARRSTTLRKRADELRKPEK